MRVGMAIGFLAAVFLASTSAARADCMLSCQDECRQAAASCNAGATVNAALGVFTCGSDNKATILDCQDTRVQDLDGCVGLCGTELTACQKDAAANFKECTAPAKETFKSCKGDVRTAAKEDKAACASDLADCLAGCTE